MIKVITYGTYDLLHYGHIRLLERAKALGDYLIVGVTADDYDKTRGKINVQQSLMERIEAVRATGIADEIIVEEYEGQKIDDIKRHDVDVFTIGSDWTGEFDYLDEYCKVVYLDRTEGVSSSDIRTKKSTLKLGLAGESIITLKFAKESQFVNGVTISGLYTLNEEFTEKMKQKMVVYSSYHELLENSDAVYIASHPDKHYEQVHQALEMGKHVLCEAPITMEKKKCEELFELAAQNGIILMDSIKTAYSTAYDRLLLLVKGGKIGEIVSVDATCTSLRDVKEDSSFDYNNVWNSITAWGPTALLPIFQLLGTDYRTKHISTRFADKGKKFDAFTKIDFIFENAVATIKVGKGVKSEGELIISGTKGYVYVPAPWWKTDYFEVRYENVEENKRYFYQLDGEGIRYEIVAFIKSIDKMKKNIYIEHSVSNAISKVIEDFNNLVDVQVI